MTTLLVKNYLQGLRRDRSLWAVKLCKIRDKDNKIVPLAFNQVQREIAAIEEEERQKSGSAFLYILKARQGGVSTYEQAANLHLIWAVPGATALTLAHSRDDTDKIFMITRRMISHFPRDLLPTIGRAESKEVTFPGLDSYFWTGTAGAQRVGRGITLMRFHGSEFAFWDQPRTVLGSVTPALVPAGAVVVLETTADAYESDAHRFWNDAVNGENGYRAVFFPWWECDPTHYRTPLMEPDELGALEEDEKALVRYHHLDLEQIKFRRVQMKKMGGRLEFMREYAEDPDSCWVSAGEKFFDVEVIMDLMRRAPQPIATEMNGQLAVYADPIVDVGSGTIIESVIIGCDVAEGSGGDRSAWTARSFPRGRLLARFASTVVEPEDLAAMLNTWGMERYHGAFLVIEKNSHGITVLRKLRKHYKYPTRLIYHRTPLNKEVDVKTDYIGWATTSESRPLLLDAGRDILRAANEGWIDIPSREALRDAWAVTDGTLTGRDVLVSEMLCWIGREHRARRGVKPLAPLHY